MIQFHINYIKYRDKNKLKQNKNVTNLNIGIKQLINLMNMFCIGLFKDQQIYHLVIIKINIYQKQLIMFKDKLYLMHQIKQIFQDHAKLIQPLSVKQLQMNNYGKMFQEMTRLEKVLQQLLMLQNKIQVQKIVIQLLNNKNNRMINLMMMKRKKCNTILILVFHLHLNKYYKMFQNRQQNNMKDKYYHLI